MTDIIAAIGSALGGGVIGVVAVQGRNAFRDWLADRRVDHTEHTAATAAEAREETARHRIAGVAQAREDRLLERLHDECRKEVADLRAEVREERDARLELARDVAAAQSDVSRCEERHSESERRHAERHDENERRIARLERRSNPPVPEHAE